MSVNEGSRVVSTQGARSFTDQIGDLLPGDMDDISRGAFAKTILEGIESRAGDLVSFFERCVRDYQVQDAPSSDRYELFRIFLAIVEARSPKFVQIQ